MKIIIRRLISFALFNLAHFLYRSKTIADDTNKILVIDVDLPRYDLDAGSVRMRELLKILVLLGCEVTFISDKFNYRKSYIRDLRSDGIQVIAGRIPSLAFILLTKKYFSKIILSRPQIFQEYIKYVRKFMPQSKVIYDSVDLHWIRLARMAKILECKKMLSESERIKKIELANIELANLTIAVSQDERLKMLNEIPLARIEIFPVIYRSSRIRPKFKESSGLLFVGNFLHAPNEDAVLYFLYEIFPHVLKEIPNVEFKIVGANMPPSLLKLKSANVNPIGYVSNISQIFNVSRLFVCPLRFGAGIKGKLIQSLAFGLPVISTSIGTEGVPIQDGIHCSVADDPIMFAKKTIEMYRNSNQWSLYSAEGISLVENYYTSNANEKNIKSILEI